MSVTGANEPGDMNSTVVPTASPTASPADRLRLVDAVWQDDHPETWPALDPEWLAEIRRRSAEFDAGRMTASPGEDVQARVRRKAGLDD
jgi:putative addiction module component (TIGR02574 family)